MIKRTAIFLSLQLLFIIGAVSAMVAIPKGELHLLLCAHHTPWWDTFFRLYTQIGEWVPYVVAVCLLFYRAGWSVFVTAGIIGSGLMTQVVKHLVNAQRPLTWFAENMPDVQLPLVEGVRMSQYYSFPSGHTTSFFALFLALSLTMSRTQWSQCTKNTLQIIFLLLAILGGYSRIYLSQHFAADVVGGSLMGSAIVMLLWWGFSRCENQKWWQWNLKMQKNALFCKKNA